MDASVTLLLTLQQDNLITTEPWFKITPDPTPATTQTIDIKVGRNESGVDVFTMNNSTFRTDDNSPILLLSKMGNNSYPDNPKWNVYNFGSNSSTRIIQIQLRILFICIVTTTSSKVCEKRDGSVVDQATHSAGTCNYSPPTGTLSSRSPPIIQESSRCTAMSRGTPRQDFMLVLWKDQMTLQNYQFRVSWPRPAGTGPDLPKERSWIRLILDCRTILRHLLMFGLRTHDNRWIIGSWGTVMASNGMHWVGCWRQARWRIGYDRDTSEHGLYHSTSRVTRST